MPERLHETKLRLSGLQLSPRDVNILCSIDPGDIVDFDGKVGVGAIGYFDKVARGRNAKVVMNWCVFLD